MKFLAKTLGALASSALILAAVPGAASAQPSASTAAAALPKVAYTALAYGTYVSALDTTIASGPTPLASISCTMTAGKTVNQSIAGVNLGVLGKIGAVSTQARTIETDVKRTYTGSRVAGVNLLGGRITADAISAGSSAYAGSGDTRTGGNSFSLANLKIAGQPISATVAKNTRVSIPGVAEVTVNKQAKVTSPNGRYTVQTIGLSVRVLPGNPLRLPTDTVINVAFANSILDPVQGSSLHSGSGYSTQVALGNGAVKSSATALAMAPCTGGTVTNSAARVQVPLLVDTGTTTTTATGGTDGPRDWTRVTNRTASPRILGGLISADALVADTTVSRTGGVTTVSDNSSLVGLRIAGRTIAAADLAPNSKIEIPGIAKVTVRHQTKSANSIAVTLLRVELLTGTGGQPAGAVIDIGSSRSGLL